MKYRIAALLGLALLLAACGRGPEPTDTAAAPPPAQPSEDARLAAFFEAVFQRNLDQSPQFQAHLGIKTDDYGRWDDYSEAWAVTRNGQVEADLARLEAEFDYAALDPESQLSYRVFEWEARRALRNFPWRHHRYAVSQMDNIAAELGIFLQNQHRVDTEQDGRDYIGRLAGVEKVMAQIVERLRLGEAAGVIPPAMVYERVLPVAANVLEGWPLEDAAQDSVLLADFRRKVLALQLGPEATTGLLREAEDALKGPFRRGYQALIAELERLQALAPGNHGVWALPEGAAFYANRIRHWTTVERSATELHELGLAEVARIRAEMQAILDGLGFVGDLPAFFEHLRSDPDNYYPDTDAGRQAYIDDATALIEGLYTIADGWFNVLPKAPLEVRRVEPWREQGSGTAFYDRPAPDGSRPGIYYINLADMGQVQKHIMNSLAYHEGAPGHHFQLAIQQELEGVPEFRKYLSYSAYSEGWALYAERVAFEAGLYEGLPVRDFGRLAEEMKRAVRLVVDTGMHALGWSREQCIDYMNANTPMAPADIERQIERYFVWPGQALSYKVGMMTILELRERARAALGDQFDVRDFHDVVLKNGAMPLEILDKAVEAYIRVEQTR